MSSARLDSEGGNYAVMCKMIQEVQTNFIGIAEHDCLDPTKNPHFSQICYDTIRKWYYHHNRLTMGTT
jgi:hypothetical protein